MKLPPLSQNKILFLLFVLALLIRIAFLSTAGPIKWWDETVYLNMGLDLATNPFHYAFDGSWSDAVSVGWPNAGFRPPVLPYLLSLFYFFNLDFLTSLLFPLLGALTVVAIYLLALQLKFSAKESLYAAFLVAILPVHAYYSAKALNDSVAVLLLILSALFYWKAIQQKEKTAFPLLMAGLLFGLSLLTRYTMVVMLPAFFLHWVYVHRHDWKKVEFGVFFLFFFLTLLPWFIYGIAYYSDPLGWFWHGALLGNQWGGHQAFYHLAIRFIETFGFLAPLGLAGFVLLAREKSNEPIEKRPVVFLLLFLLFFIFHSIYSHKEDRFLLPLLPLVSIFAAVAINRIQSFWKPIVVGLVLIGSVWGMISISSSEWSPDYQVQSQCVASAMHYLKTVPSHSLIITDESPTVYYYTGLASQFYPASLDATFPEIESKTKGPIYFLTIGKLSLPNQLFVEENAQRVFDCPGSFPPVAVYHYS